MITRNGDSLRITGIHVITNYKDKSNVYIKSGLASVINAGSNLLVPFSETIILHCLYSSIENTQ